VLTASVHRLRASGCIPGALDLFGVLTATDLAARSSMPRLPCRLLDATVTVDALPVPKRHGQGGAIRIVITILCGLATYSGRFGSTRLDPPALPAWIQPGRHPSKPTSTVKMLRDQAAINRRSTR
jgi:hypothetical protein